MTGSEHSDLHVISLGDDPSLGALADLLETTGHRTILLQPHEGLADLVETVRSLNAEGDLQALHLYGHGSEGVQQLGRDTITPATVKAQQSLWHQLAQFTREGSDILLYGCQTGAGPSGANLVDALSQASGMDVAASDDITGSTNILDRGDWDLEVRRGSVSTTAAAITRQWEGDLQLEHWDHSDHYPFQLAPLRWSVDPQDPGQERAVLTVPLDYDRPDKETATIAMGRIPATGKAPIGSLFFNPGGPGGSGLNSLRYIHSRLPEAVQERFDLVSFDPRGIGASTPTLKASDGEFPITPEPGSTDWTATLDASREVFRATNIQTQIANHSFINHLGTKNVARDLEMMRQAIGDDKLNYLGLSYGTRIGYTYAAMFPNNIRTLILDGNINPNGDYADLTAGAAGPDIALNLTKEKDPSVAEAFNLGFNTLRQSSIPLGNGLSFNLNDYIELATARLAAGPESLDQIKNLSSIVIDAASATPEAADAQSKLSTYKPQQNDNAGGMFSVVNLLDYADRPTEQQQHSNVETVMRKGPLGGPLAVSYAAGGEGFQLNAEPVPDMSRQRLKDKVAQIPVLISNATADAMTPRFWAVPMTEAFTNHSFLEQISTKHCISLNPDSCLRSAVETYLLKAELPPSDLCPWPGISAS